MNPCCVKCGQVFTVSSLVLEGIKHQTAGQSDSNQIPSQIQFLMLTVYSVFSARPKGDVALFILGHLIEPSDRRLSLSLELPLHYSCNSAL